jgi:hypothetical protein
VSARLDGALTSLHRLLAAVAVVGFPAAGLATALGHLTSGAFLAIAAASCVTFGSALVALSRERLVPKSPARRGPQSVPRTREAAFLR